MIVHPRWWQDYARTRLAVRRLPDHDLISGYRTIEEARKEVERARASVARISPGRLAWSWLQGYAYDLGGRLESDVRAMQRVGGLYVQEAQRRRIAEQL